MSDFTFKSYDSSDIKVLKGLDAVRKRPGMYIGNVEDGSGLHRMIFEVVDNSVDESLEGFCNFISVILCKDNWVTVKDNGRGIPVDYHEDEGISAAEVIMTILHSGSKFDEKSYKISGGLHGVGVSVVNALSSDLCLRIFRNCFIYEQMYKYGKPVTDLIVAGKTEESGTEISFLPDVSVFYNISFDYNILLDRFIELSYLNPGVSISLIDKRNSNIVENTILNTGGVKSFLEYLNSSKILINKEILYFSGTHNNVNLNIAFQWVDSSRENIRCYVNNIYQKDGGSHLVGFKNVLTRVFKYYIENEVLKNSNFKILGDDIREGLVAIVSLRMSNPKFSSQVKDKLISLEAKIAVESFLFSKLKEYLYENPVVSKLISNRVILAYKAREAARKAKEMVKKKNLFCFLPGKLSDCQDSNPASVELFIVEGDSAGGSAKQARDRKFQAILPIKGKILNVEKSNFDKMVASTEIGAIVSALGCGISSSNYDIEKLRYHKIIFMTDADVDGAHIRTLLLTFFYRQMKKIIELGYIYIARPPLYGLKKGNDIFYIKDEASLSKFFLNIIFIEFKNLVSKFSGFSDDLFLRLVLLYENFSLVLFENFREYPKFFFESLLFFSGKIYNNIHDNDILLNFVNDLQVFFDKMCNSNSRFFFNIDTANGHKFRIKEIKHGVVRNYKIDVGFFNSTEYKVFLELNLVLSEFFESIGSIEYESKRYYKLDFFSLIDKLFIFVSSKYKIQRYKGLGEMSPKQLWDTTMNPETRILSRVNINDVLSAEKVFSVLMGDEIKSRKKFINSNIVDFYNIDV